MSAPASISRWRSRRIPELLILDEPTLGLDVVAKRAFLEAVLSSIDEGDTTIIYCSHQMDEIERLADNLIILERGELKHMSPPDEFCERVALWVAEFAFVPPAAPVRCRACCRCSASTGCFTTSCWTRTKSFGALLDAQGARRHFRGDVNLDRAVNAFLARNHATPADGVRCNERPHSLGMAPLPPAVADRRRSCHGLALLLLSRVVDVPQLGYEDQGMMLAVYMLLGLALALLQVGSYRQTSRWLWLIHRPLPPARIFAALALSALASAERRPMLAPLLVFLVATHAFTTQVVDSRHYVAIFHALAFAMMAWLAGAHACTSRSKAAVAVLLAPVMLALHSASVWWLLLPVIVCLAWLVFVARHSFRADRSAPIARHRRAAADRVAAAARLLPAGVSAEQGGPRARRPARHEAPAGRCWPRTRTSTSRRMMRSIGQNFIVRRAGEQQRSARRTWREQLPLLQMAGLQPTSSDFPFVISSATSRSRGGTTSATSSGRSVTTACSSTVATRSAASRAAGGERAGIGSPEPFAEVPSFGMTRAMLYAIDDESQRQHELVRLPAGEWFVARPVNALDRVLLLTNRRLLAYRPDRERCRPSRRRNSTGSFRCAEGEPRTVNRASSSCSMAGWCRCSTPTRGSSMASSRSPTRGSRCCYVDADGTGDGGRGAPQHS